MTLLLLLACVAQRAALQPIVAEGVLPGPEGAVYADAAGVRLIVATDAWEGQPESLESVTPLLVTLENGSSVPLRVDVGMFALVAEDGRHFAAYAPLDISGGDLEPYPTASGTLQPVVLEYIAETDEYLPITPRVQVVDPSRGRTYTPRYVKYSLPTPSMIEQALPEGTLAPGEMVSGFVYFRNPDPSLPRVTFEARLANASNGARFATVRLPFGLTDVDD